MPYSDEEKQKFYENTYHKGYQRGYWVATVHHLGAKCLKCGNTNIEQLEIHHIHNLNKAGRNSEDWKDLSELELRCKPDVNDCHSDDPGWRGKRRKMADVSAD